MFYVFRIGTGKFGTGDFNLSPTTDTDYSLLLYICVQSLLHLSEFIHFYAKESFLRACVLWLKSWVCVRGLSVQEALHSPQQLCAGSSLTPQDWTEGRSQTNSQHFLQHMQEHAVINSVEEIDENSTTI